jgi:hypothetical protein
MATGTHPDASPPSSGPRPATLFAFFSSASLVLILLRSAVCRALLFWAASFLACWWASSGLDLLGIVLQVLLIVLDPVEPVAKRPRLSSVVSSAAWLWVHLDPGTLSGGESSPG